MWNNDSRKISRTCSARNNEIFLCTCLHSKVEDIILSDTFLSYHPSLAVGGERSLKKNTSMSDYLDKMPPAFSNQTVIVKSTGIWMRHNVHETLLLHKMRIPRAKILMIVRDPIHRYVSDILQYNVKNPEQAYDNIDDIVQGNVQTRPYYPAHGKIY